MCLKPILVICLQDSKQQQQQQRRPTLSQIHAPKSLSVVLKQGTSQQTTAAAVNGAKWVWEAPDVSDPDESESSDFEDGDSQYGNFTVRVESSHQTPTGLGRERLAGVFRRSSEDGTLTGDEAAMTGEQSGFCLSLVFDCVPSACICNL